MLKTKDLTVTNIVIVITIIMYLVQINMQYGGYYLGLNIYFTREDFFGNP